MNDNRLYYMTKEAIAYLENARELIDKIEAETNSCALGDSLTEIIEALDYVGFWEFEELK